MKIGDLIQPTRQYIGKKWPGLLGIIIKQGTYQKDDWSDNESFVVLWPSTGEIGEYWSEDLCVVGEK